MMRLMVKVRSSLMAAVCLLTFFSASSAAAQEVTVEYPGLGQQQQLQLQQPLRLSEVLEQTVFALGSDEQLKLYWPGSRFGSDKLQAQLQQQRRELLKDLRLLEQYWVRRGRVEIKRTINFLIREVEQMNLRASYYFAVEPDRVRVLLQQNPLLTRSEGTAFYLRVPSTVPGRVHIGLSEQTTGADTEWVWQVAQNGDVKHIPIGLSNRHQNAQCYLHRVSSPLTVGEPEICEPTDKLTQGITFRGIAASYLPGEWQSINRRIVEIIKHRIE